MPQHINVAGTWKNSTVWINVAGTWKKAAVWQNVAGVWKQITTLITATLPASMFSQWLVFSGTADAYVTLNSAGTWLERGGSNGTWIDGVNPASAYEARWTNTSGTLSYGTADTWLALSTTRSWGVQKSSPVGIKSCSGTLEIREAASGTVLDSASVTLEAIYDI
jgi:hypothetical protein